MAGLSRDRPGVAAAAGGCTRGFDARPGCTRRRRGRRAVELLVEPLQHPHRLFAAGHTEIETGLLAAGDHFGIVVAVVAALAAVLLRHRRHHAATQRSAFRELHSLGDRQALIVPRRIVVGAGGLFHHRRAGRIRQRLHAARLGRHQPGKEAIEPRALLRRERRAVGDEIERWRRHLVHCRASIIFPMASTPARRAKATKVSSAPVRLAR